MRTKKIFSVLLVLSILMSIFSFVINISYETPWIQLGDQDADEGGKNNDWRDVKYAYYAFGLTDSSSLDLKLEVYGIVGSEWPKGGGRYKWFIDIENPSNMRLSGGNIVDAEFLLYVEDSDDDGLGDFVIFEDSDNDGSFNDEYPLSVSPSEASFDIDGNSISMSIDLSIINNPSDLSLAWATDQEDPNRDAAPKNDRIDGNVGIPVKVLSTSIIVQNVVIGDSPSDPWKYSILGPDSYNESFSLPATGSPPAWSIEYGVTSGDYVVRETSKFGFHTYVEVQGDTDEGSVISGLQVNVDLDEGEKITIIYTNTFLPAFAISLDSEPPANLDYNIPPLVPTFAQSAWSTDINSDSRIDLVYEKPAAVMINFSSVSVSSSLSVSLDFLGTTYGPVIKTSSELATNPIVSFYPISPDVVGDTTLMGSYSIDGGSSIALTSIDVTVKATTSPQIAYSYLYKVDRRGNLDEYEDVALTDFIETVGNSTYLLNTTYPVSNIVTDESYVGIEGADKGNKRDPFKGLLTDALAVAQEAQLRMGGTAIGIGIGPNNSGIDDYFAYHGFDGAAGLSFGPSVKGVLILDGYYGGSAHEVAHTFGLYYGQPEQYQIDPLYGTITSGVHVESGEWMTGYDFMGAVAYGTLEDTWVDSSTFTELFQQFVDSPDDPEILLASAIINSNGTVEFPNTWYSFDEGIPDGDLSGDYALIFVDEFGNELYQTSFDASFEVQIGGYPGVLPGTDGDLINQTAFDTMKTNSTGFSFVMPYPSGTAEVQIWNKTIGEGQLLAVMDADNIVHLQKYDIEAWTTSSNFENISILEANFKKDGKTQTSTLISTNPGTTYLNLVVENNEDHSITPKITITLPDTNSSLEELTQAFTLKGATPIHVYSDLEMNNEITQTTGITVDGKIITLDLTLPEAGLAYVTIHLDYALKGTEGWEFNAAQTYHVNVPFNIYAPHLLTDSTLITDLEVPFEVIGT